MNTSKMASRCVCVEGFPPASHVKFVAGCVRRIVGASVTRLSRVTLQPTKIYPPQPAWIVQLASDCERDERLPDGMISNVVYKGTQLRLKFTYPAPDLIPHSDMWIVLDDCTFHSQTPTPSTGHGCLVYPQHPQIPVTAEFPGPKPGESIPAAKHLTYSSSGNDKSSPETQNMPPNSPSPYAKPGQGHEVREPPPVPRPVDQSADRCPDDPPSCHLSEVSFQNSQISTPNPPAVYPAEHVSYPGLGSAPSGQERGNPEHEGGLAGQHGAYPQTGGYPGHFGGYSAQPVEYPWKRGDCSGPQGSYPQQNAGCSVLHGESPVQPIQYPEEGRNYPDQHIGYPGEQAALPGQYGGYPFQQAGNPQQPVWYYGQHTKYPGEQASYQGQHEGYPGQHEGYPGQHEGYPGQLEGYPGQTKGHPEQPAWGGAASGQRYPVQRQVYPEQHDRFPKPSANKHQGTTKPEKSSAKIHDQTPPKEGRSIPKNPKQKSVVETSSGLQSRTPETNSNQNHREAGSRMDQSLQKGHFVDSKSGSPDRAAQGRPSSDRLIYPGQGFPSYPGKPISHPQGYPVAVLQNTHQTYPQHQSRFSEPPPPYPGTAAGTAGQHQGFPGPYPSYPSHSAQPAGYPSQPTGGSDQHFGVLGPSQYSNPYEHLVSDSSAGQSVQQPERFCAQNHPGHPGKTSVSPRMHSPVQQPGSKHGHHMKCQSEDGTKEPDSANPGGMPGVDSKGALRIVEVRVGQNPKSQEIYEYYFENPRYGGGDVENVDVDRRKGVVYVTFMDPEVAARIVKRQHTISGQHVEVKLHPYPVRRTTYPDKLLFHNVSDTTTKEHLNTFLELVSGLEPVEILYSDEPGVVLITFKDEPDFIRVQNKCSERPLDGRKLSVSKVPISKCLLIENLSPVTSEDSVVLYFENKRSLGGPVDKCVMLPVDDEEEDEGESMSRKCLLYFADHEAVDRVLTKTHTIDGRQLCVKRYMECLGLSGGVADPSVFPIPKPLILREVDSFKIMFIRQSIAASNAFKQQLFKTHAQFSFVGDTIQLECTLTSDVPNCRVLAKSWSADVQRVVMKYMGQIEAHRVEVMQQIWPTVESCITNNNGFQLDDAVTIPVPNEAIFVVIGMPHAAKDLKRKVREEVKVVEDEVERKKLEIRDTVTRLKPYQLRLLEAMSFPEQASSQHDGLSIEIDSQAITFQGQLGDVRDVQVLMYERLNCVQAEKITGMSNSKTALLGSLQTSRYIADKLKATGLLAVWEAGQQGDVMVYSLSVDDLSSAVEAIRASLVEHNFDLSPESAKLLRSDSGQNLVQHLREAHLGMLLISTSSDTRELTLTGTDQIMPSVTSELERFIEENTIYSQVVAFSPSRQRFLGAYWIHKLPLISSELTAHQVQISLREADAEMVVQGTEKGLQLAKERLRELHAKIVCRVEKVTDRTKLRFLHSDRGIRDVQLFERSNQCVISRLPENSELQIRACEGAEYDADEMDAEAKDKEGDWNQVPRGDLSRHMMQGQIKITLIDGEIARETTDVIVNTTSAELDLSAGAVSASILAVGGSSLQGECRARYPNGIVSGDIATTRGHNLACKEVYHLTLCSWSTGGEKTLEQTVTKCLTEASNSGHTSIAFPALGTGNMNYPRDVVARTMMDAVNQFQQANPTTSLREVRIVVYYKDTKTSQVFRQVWKGCNVSPAAAAKVTHATATPLQASSAGSIQLGPIKVTIADGEIAKEIVHVIVNTTSNDLQLTNGAVSASLLAAAGSSLQDECRTQYPNGITTGDVAKTKGHNLACREVYHLTLCSWSPGVEKTLEQTVTKCLTEASNSGHTSIAFPALGTGNMNYPRDVVAGTMMHAVNHFQQATPTTSLREVRIVVYHKDTKTRQEFRHVQAQYGTVITADNLPGPSVGPVSFGSVTINVIDGEIAKEKTHVIVNTTSSDLQLANGAVSASLLAAAGSSLQDECRTQYPNGITTGDVAKTKGHNLACREVYHLTLCSWSPGVEKTLEQTVTKCLTEASNSGHTSIAFPALGTGKMNYPRDVVARTMMDAVSQFQQANPTTSLREVRIVVYHKDTQTSQVFQKELQKYSSSPASAAAPAAAAPAATTQAMPTGNRQRRRFPESGITAGGQQFSPPMQGPSPAVAQIPADTTLYIYAASEDNAQAVLNALDEAVMEKYIQKVVKDDILKAIGQDGTQRIKQAAEQRDVEVKVDQSTGCVVLDGLYSKVYEAQHDILDILRTAEIQRHKEATASMIASMVQWSFLEVTATGTQPFEYARRENHIIEAAYQKKEKTAEITDADGNVYIIDFNSMQEHPKNNPTDAVAVIRRDKTKTNTDSSDTAFKLPKTWTSQNSSDTVSVVRLQPNSSEYKEVEKNFKKTVGSTVTAVDRIQNPLLYQQYAAKKSHLEKQNTGIQNEKTLWHGTAPDAIDNINRYGFNRSYCGKNATAYGQGVYFAVNSSYSANPTYSRPDASGNRFMYQCKVLVGHATRGNSGMRFLPTRTGPIVYDSAADNPSGPSMYIIFNDTQAYPEYLVTFR